jgi:DNA-binding IclR family transcriptional regulator
VAKETKSGGESLGTVERVITLLRIVAEATEDIPLKDVAEQADLALSTTHRLLNILAESGLVQRGKARATYSPGMEFLRLGSKVVARMDLNKVAAPFLSDLVAELDETCFLATYLPTHHKMMVNFVRHGSHPLRFEIPLHAEMTIAWGATGRAILAFLPDALIDEVIALEESSPVTGQDLPKPQIFKRQLAAIREAGVAISSSQKIEGATGIAVPVFHADGSVVASLCMTVPVTRTTEALTNKIARRLMEKGRELSMALGYTPAPSGKGQAPRGAGRRALAVAP